MTAEEIRYISIEPKVSDIYVHIKMFIFIFVWMHKHLVTLLMSGWNVMTQLFPKQNVTVH